MRTQLQTLQEEPNSTLAGNSFANSEAALTKRQMSAIVIIEQRHLIRDCLVKCLRDIDVGHSVMAFATIEEWIEVAPQYPPLLILFSLTTPPPDVSALRQSLSQLRHNSSGAPVVVISDSTDAGQVIAALSCGVRGYIPTSIPLSIAFGAIRLVRAGGTFTPTSALMNAPMASKTTSLEYDVTKKVAFTGRQLAVLTALRRGKANKQIAYEMNMREGTVKVHVRHAAPRSE